MHLHFGRQVTGSCDAGKSFYRCAKGPFAGCCSTDPCDTGICGDDNNSEPTTLQTSNKPSTTANPSPSTRNASRSSSVATPTSALTSTATSPSVLTTTGSRTSPSDSAASRSTSTEPSVTSTLASNLPSSTSTASDDSQPPIGPVVGGVLGGVAFLALLATLLRYLLQRKSKMRIKIKRDKKKRNEKRERDSLEAEAAIPERERFLDAAKQKSAPEVNSEDPFAEFGGYYRGTQTVAVRPEHRYNHQQTQLPSSASAPSQAEKPLPAVTTTPVPASTRLHVQQNSMPLPSISEKEAVESAPHPSISEKEVVENVPLLHCTEPTLAEMPASTNELASDENDVSASRAALPVSRLAFLHGQRINDSARTSITQSTDLSSFATKTNSYANSASPVSPVFPREVVAQDGVVMKSNLNGSRNAKSRPESVAKHVMSFMEYDTENDSTGSNSQRSSLRGPGKAPLVGDQGRSNNHQDSSSR